MAEPKKPFVVVVNNDLADVIGRTLDAGGIDAIPFVSGPEALADDRLKDASLVISDWHNPPLWGHGLWKALTEQHPHIPVMYLSARDVANEPQFKEAAMTPIDIMELPYSARELVKRVKACLGQGETIIHEVWALERQPRIWSASWTGTG